MDIINHPEIQKIERAALERDWLRAAYDAAVEKIKADRPGRMLGAASTTLPTLCSRRLTAR
jgi:hypothetical protein